MLEVGRVALEGPSAELEQNDSVQKGVPRLLDDRVLPTGRRRARVRIHLRPARARDRDHLPLDRGRELRPGRDGDVHDVHRVDARRPRPGLLGRVCPHAADRVRRWGRARANHHPAGRGQAVGHGRDPHDRPLHHARRPDELDLGGRGSLLPAEPAVPDRRVGRSAGSRSRSRTSASSPSRSGSSAACTRCSS